MRKSPWTLLVLFAIAAVAWWWGRPKPLDQSSAPPTETREQTHRKEEANVEPKLVTSPAQLQQDLHQSTPTTPFVRIEAPPPPPVQVPAGYAAGSPPDSATQEAEEVALNLRNFSLRFGGNPVGTNAEITKALNTGNQVGANYLPSSRRLNGQGELIDQWGSPYFFHANSATSMEVRSAGPDRKLYTTDDVIAR